MIIGGNDGWPMDTPAGDRVSVGSSGWVDEYARRTAAVMRTFGDGGRAVYWAGPPTARANGWDNLYRKINRADRAAADAIQGAQYVDLVPRHRRQTALTRTYVADGSKKIKARQSDGVHWSFGGAHLPARLAHRVSSRPTPASTCAEPGAAPLPAGTVVDGCPRALVVDSDALWPTSTTRRRRRCSPRPSRP